MLTNGRTYACYRIVVSAQCIAWNLLSLRLCSMVIFFGAMISVLDLFSGPFDATMDLAYGDSFFWCLCRIWWRMFRDGCQVADLNLNLLMNISFCVLHCCEWWPWFWRNKLGCFLGQHIIALAACYFVWFFFGCLVLERTGESLVCDVR